ncbi:class II fructose-bisphosphate aldolase [Butyricicoccus sp. OF10-2]|nr:class II fructose-bisphosphate aldolase [Butyricicoccus sp. OF10-2]RHV83093.1 class II fructose-bisphosphate aldolase [Butyricicoccus sp. OF10-2]
MKWEQNYVAQAAQQKRIIPGFNIFGYEDAQAVIRAAERAVCPVLLMINRDARTAMAVEHWSALLNALAESSSVPVGIHLDHCTETDTLIRAIDSGFTSVMFDGSHLPITENLKITQAIAQYAHKKNVFLEAELGTVPYSDIGETEINLTDPEEAREMQEQTQVDWLAVSVGNIHRLATRKVPFNFLFCSKLNTNANYLW